MKGKLRRFKANRMELVISQLVVDQNKPSLRDFFKDRICAELGIKKNSYTYMLNNTGQPTLGQLVIIASILEATLDQLVETEETDAMAPQFIPTDGVELHH